MKKTAILGGSFDPIHNGHLFMAETVLKQNLADEVLFIPLGDPPHKTNITSADHRLCMVEKALQGRKNMLMSRMEVERVGRTYTIDTVRCLKEKYPHTEFSYVIGEDTVRELSTWRDFETLAGMIDFLVICRSGYVEDKAAVKSKLESLGAHIVFVESDEVPVSSTQIRHCVEQGEDISGLVPCAVEAYIKEKGLYEKK